MRNQIEMQQGRRVSAGVAGAAATQEHHAHAQHGDRASERRGLRASALPGRSLRSMPAPDGSEGRLAAQA